jgi:dephospho-CoA kinase
VKIQHAGRGPGERWTSDRRRPPPVLHDRRRQSCGHAKRCNKRKYAQREHRILDSRSDQPTNTSPAESGPDGCPTAPRIVLGLLGGIGSGKSHVASRLAALAGEAPIETAFVDADQLAHEALSAFATSGRLAEVMGPEFVHEGRPDVKALGARVFSDPDLLRRLERLLHPPVHAAIKAAIDSFRAAGAQAEAAPTGALLVLDVPLLIEVGLDRSCDNLWFVETPDEIRAVRAEGRGLSMEQIHAREAFQSPQERKRARADRVIRNDVDPDALDAQIRAGLLALGLPPQDPSP